MGGHAVVKVPYSNAGQGVFTITSPAELAAFMAEESRYDKYIVQALVVRTGGEWMDGGSGWEERHRREESGQCAFRSR